MESSEFKAARECLWDAWAACRPTHFADVRLEETEILRLRHVYVVPGREGCGLVLFEHVRGEAGQRRYFLDRFACETLESRDVCGGFELGGCTLVESVEFADESWNE